MTGIQLAKKTELEQVTLQVTQAVQTVENMSENVTELEEEVTQLLTQITATPEANKILKLGNDAKYPASALPYVINGNLNGVQAKSSNGNGVGIFQFPNSLIILHAVQISNPNNYIYAVGFKPTGAQTLNVISNNALTLGASNAVGTQVINGAPAEDVLIYAQSNQF